MKNPLLIALACGASLQGCTTFNFDYQPPVSGETAKLTIKSTWDGHNQRVIFHGANTCNPGEAKLIGLINAGAIGQKNVKQIDLIVPAGSDVKISIPQFDLTAYGGSSATFRYCQPIASFIPVPGQSYTLEFGSCSANLYINDAANSQDPQKAQVKLDRSCKVTAENKGTNDKIFYLEDKP